jgi:hypothetical protein
VGDPLREALFCEGGAPLWSAPGGESTFPVEVVDATGGHMHKLLKAPLYAGAMDFEKVFYVQLDAALSADGKTITLTERAELTCAMARAKAKNDFPNKEDAQNLKDYLGSIDHACAGPRRYTWQGGRFQSAR